MGVLAELEREMDAVDLAGCDASDLRDLTRRVYRAEKVVEGWKRRLAAAARSLEDSGSGPPAGSTLGTEGGLSRGRSKELADQAGLLAPLPAVSAAAQSGRAHPENVDAVARTMRGLSEPERAALGQADTVLARELSETPPEMFALGLRDRVRQIRDGLAGDGETDIERRRRESELTLRPSRHRHGMFAMWGNIDDERGAVLDDLVTAEARRLAGDGPVTANHRMTALYNLMTRTGQGGPAPRMGVGWIADTATGPTGPHPGSVAETWAGVSVDPVTIERLACDADWYTTWLDAKGFPMWVSYQARTATREQRLALRALYPTCPIDGATVFADCEVHHLVAVDDGGETSIDNLVPVSWTWHHRIHDKGWRLVMDPDRTLHLYRPDGTLDRTIAPPTPITRHGP